MDDPPDRHRPDPGPFGLTLGAPALIVSRGRAYRPLGARFLAISNLPRFFLSIRTELVNTTVRPPALVGSPTMTQVNAQHT